MLFLKFLGGMLANDIIDFSSTEVTVRVLEYHLTSCWHEVDDGQRGVGVAHVHEADLS